MKTSNTNESPSIFQLILVKYALDNTKEVLASEEYYQDIEGYLLERSFEIALRHMLAGTVLDYDLTLHQLRSHAPSLEKDWYKAVQYYKLAVAPQRQVASMLSLSTITATSWEKAIAMVNKQLPTTHMLCYDATVRDTLSDRYEHKQ